MKNILSPCIFLSSLLSLTIWSTARAQDIQFQDDELPTEAVEALVDRQEAVIQPNVVFANRLKLDLGVGFLMDEPFWENQNLTARVFYNFTETRAFGFSYQMYNRGKSSYAKQLEETSANLEFERAPALKSSYFGYFQMKPFYGKISFSKAATFNTSLYIMLGAGMVQYGTKSNPGFVAGGGQEFFVNNRFGFGVDLSLQGHMAPDATSAPLRASQPVPTEGDFKTTLRLRTHLSTHVLVLF